MKEKIKDVKWPTQGAVLQHFKLFKHMGHGLKGRKQHEGGQKDQGRVRDLPEKVAHGKN